MKISKNKKGYYYKSVGFYTNKNGDRTQKRFWLCGKNKKQSLKLAIFIKEKWKEEVDFEILIADFKRNDYGNYHPSLYRTDHVCWTSIKLKFIKEHKMHLMSKITKNPS